MLLFFFVVQEELRDRSCVLVWLWLCVCVFTVVFSPLSCRENFPARTAPLVLSVYAHACSFVLSRVSWCWSRGRKKQSIDHTEGSPARSKQKDNTNDGKRCRLRSCVCFVHTARSTAGRIEIGMDEGDGRNLPWVGARARARVSPPQDFPRGP